MTCDTADCRGPVVSHITWSNEPLGSDRGGGDYCQECTEILSVGDVSITPTGGELFELMVTALEDTYLATIDRFDARNEFRVALRAALKVWAEA